MKSEPRASATPSASTSVDPAKVATPDDARAEMVRYTGSGYTPVRHVFVQKYDGKNRASTLARAMPWKKKRALILYLVLLTLWRADATPRLSSVWLRLVTVPGGNLTWSTSSLSETWTTLVDLDLAARTRVKRKAHVTPRREDAQADYTRPTGNTRIEHYFALPGAFWTEKWFDTLSLPAICMLLILLKETNDKEWEFHITHAQVEEWYGISASSAAKGLNELEDVGLVSTRREQVPAGLTDQGFTFHHHYSLNGAFSTAERHKARAAAAKAITARNKVNTKKAVAGTRTVKKATAKRTRKTSTSKTATP